MSAIPGARNDTTGYLEAYVSALGKLVGNLLSFELVLRMTLYELRSEPHSPLEFGRGLTTLEIGEQLPLNAMTSRDSLRSLIEKYNQLHSSDADQARLLDGSLVTLRDAFAHGRILSSDPFSPLTLIRFGKPDKGSVRVEDVVNLDLDWVQEQVRRVSREMVKISKRRGELGLDSGIGTA